MRQALALAAFCGITAALPTHAIVISAGTADSSYIDLGNSAAYRSVGQIYDTDSGGGFAASGVLLAPDWVLTAAHVTSGATSLKFFLDAGGATFTRPGIAADRWYSYSSWDGNLGSGYDIGLFHLSMASDCNCAAVRYTGTSELGGIGTSVGFGMTGTGATGAVTFDGLKRGGQNAVDAVLRTPKGTNRILLADFDSGLSGDNNFGSSAQLDLEALIAPGDSGGGLFQKFGDIEYLTGIASFGWGRLDGDPDSDYGDAAGWTRITYFNAWIDSVMGGGSGGGSGGGGGKKGPKTQASDFRETSVSVPEPGSLALLGLGIAALAHRRRRR